jgi:YD repeat-containing protein
VGSVRHPSGARADFTFGVHFQPSNSAGWLGYYPLSLQEKSISGPGLTAATWKYGISPSMEQTRTACRAGTCPKRLVTDEIAPDNSVVRRIFGLDRNVDESLLLGELHGNMLASTPSAGTPAITCSARWGCDILDDPSPITGTVPVFYREIDTRYVPATDAVDYQRVVGTNPFATGDMGFSSQRQPVKTRIVTQQGATFTRTTNDFNEFAQSESITSTSVGLIGNPGETGFTRAESTTYRHDKAAWVIGQIGTTILNGKEVRKIDYDSNSLPIRTYNFGALRKSITYDFATVGAYGALKTVADGRGNVTNVGNWKRGLPQRITFPTTAAGVAIQIADVNNIGNLNSTTDELGSTTSYGYDAMGRLSSITYPTGDTVIWNPLGRTFFLESIVAEYGIPPGHWKQTVQTGAGQTTIFYDSRWNPILTLTQDTTIGSSKSFVVRRFDALGRETFRSYPVALANINDVLQGVVTIYDALGRAYQSKQDSELGVLTATTEYLTGFRTRETNPRGLQTTTSYQAWGSPSIDKPVRIEAPQGVTTKITRDAYGKPVQITRSGPGS